LIGFANLISSLARATNATWPMVRVPDYDVHARQLQLLTGGELTGFQPFIEPKDEEAYLEFVTANYEDVIKEEHLNHFGNLDRLDPIGYTPNFTLNGTNEFVPDTTNRAIRMPFWYISPRASFMCCASYSMLFDYHIIFN
jgi:hypothetical protein